MVKRVVQGLFLPWLILAATVGCDGPAGAPTPPGVNSPTLATAVPPLSTVNSSQPRLIAAGVDKVLAHPTAYGPVVFWPQYHASSSIYGYNVETSRYFTVTEGPGIKTSVVSNGVMVAWVQGDSEMGDTALRVHDLSTGKESVLFTGQHVADGSSTSGIALDGNRLYYEARGIHMYDLATGKEVQIGSGRNPIAADGMVLWGDVQPTTPVPIVTPLPTPVEEGHSYIGIPLLCDLHMAKADGTMKDKIISDALVGAGESCGSDMEELTISGHRVAWAPSFLAGNTITLYDITTGRSEDIRGSGTVSRPVLKGDTLIWTEGPSGSNGPTGWSIHARNLTPGKVWTVVPENGSTLQQSWAIAGKKVIYTAGGYPDNRVDLYMADLETGK